MMLSAKSFTSQSSLIAKKKFCGIGHIIIFAAFFSFWEKTVLCAQTLRG